MVTIIVTIGLQCESGEAGVITAKVFAVISYDDSMILRHQLVEKGSYYDHDGSVGRVSVI